MVIDLTKQSVGVKLWIEAEGIYKLTLVDPQSGKVIVESTEPPFDPAKPNYAAVLRSVEDDLGKVFHQFSIGKGMKIIFGIPSGIFLTKPVESVKLEAVDGSWSYEL